MAIDRYLAMTGAEIGTNSVLPPKVAYMACHFSPYGTGLANLPAHLPPGSMLILNDRTPIRGHDPQRIAGQLEECIRSQQCPALLLDFQRPGEAETAALAAFLVSTLPCPVGVSESYAQGLECPVFLPPVPPDTRLSNHLNSWKGREIWLDISAEGTTVTLTPEGACTAPLSPQDVPRQGRPEKTLRCHYTIDISEDAAVFTLFRTPDDLEAMLADAQSQGVTTAVGLWQELKSL